jgi:hypothetical protein
MSTLFVMRIALLQYRLQLPGFELPERVRLRQQAYDEHSAGMLEEIAALIEQSTPPARNSNEDSRELLKSTVEAIQGESAHLPVSRAQSFLILLRGIDDLTTCLISETTRDAANSPCITS